MHGQEIFQVFTDINHSDLDLCTGWCESCAREVICMHMCVACVSAIQHQSAGDEAEVFSI